MKLGAVLTGSMGQAAVSLRVGEQRTSPSRSPDPNVPYWRARHLQAMGHRPPHADRILDSARGLGYTRPRPSARNSTLGSYRKAFFQGERLISWVEDKRIKYNLDSIIGSFRANGGSRYVFETLAVSKIYEPEFEQSLNHMGSTNNANGVTMGTGSARRALRSKLPGFRSATIPAAAMDVSAASRASVCVALEARKVVP